MPLELVDPKLPRVLIAGFGSKAAGPCQIRSHFRHVKEIYLAFVDAII